MGTIFETACFPNFHICIYKIRTFMKFHDTFFVTLDSNILIILFNEIAIILLNWHSLINMLLLPYERLWMVVELEGSG